MSPQALGLYIHVPFCARRCDYCDFFVVTGREPDPAFFDWLRRDLESSVAMLGDPLPIVDTLYFGGGTPSLVTPVAIAAMVERVGLLIPIAPGAEATIEANPETVSLDRAAAWRRAGINRLSLGVQSLDDKVLRPRGRVYTGAEAIEAVRSARRAGFENIGIDLIAGLPGETERSFLEGIDRCLDLLPEHLSLYLLETQESLKETPLSRAVAEARERLPEEGVVVAMYETAVDLMASAGYHHYEISNFARPGFESRHNLKYWTSRPWLGIGPSAHSYVDGRRFGRPADLSGWIDWVRASGAGPAGAEYTLSTAAARAREALTLRLRLLDGVDLEEFSIEWGIDPGAEMSSEIDGLIQDGLLTLGSGSLALTRRGVLLSNEAFARIL